MNQTDQSTRTDRRHLLAQGGAAGLTGIVLSGTLARVAGAQDATPTADSSQAGDCMATTTNIDTAAPVIVRHEIEIDAPLDVVWNLHTDVEAWPTWNPDITDVTLEQPLAAGASFRWQTAGLTIRSTVYALTEHARILWGGTVKGITGTHQWTFTETAGGVRVATEESWSGESVEADVANLQVALDQSILSWLQHMKGAAEAKA